MPKLLDLIGTTIASFQLGIGGARIRNNAGTIEARNAANSTLAPFSAAAISGTTLTGSTSCITPLVTTSSTSLQLQQTGDTYGTINIYAQNRDGVNGLLVQNAGLDLADVVLRGASNSGGTGNGFQANLRYEGRGSFMLDFNHSASASGEIQFVPSGVSNFEPVYFASGRNSTSLKNQLRILGSTSGYNGFTVASTAGSTLWRLPTTDGVNGQSLSTDGSANLIWNFPSQGKRQTVLSGSISSSTGLLNALSIGSGLAVTLTASSETPFVISFANGYEVSGQSDLIGRFTANQSFSSLTANTTCFLFVDYSAGTLTTGFTTLQPIYAPVAPVLPDTGQHWFNTITYVMRRWSGSAWVTFNRVFVGACVTGASTVTSVTNYQYSRVSSIDSSVMLAKTKLQAALARRSPSVLAAIPPVMASPPTFFTSTAGGGSGITSPVTKAYNDSKAVSFRGLVPVLRSQFGTDYWSNGANGAWTNPPFWVEFNHHGQNFAILFRDMVGGSAASFWVWTDIGDGNGFRVASAAIQTSTANAAGSLFRYRVNFGSVAQRRVRVLMHLADYGGIESDATGSISAVETSQQTRIAFLGDSYIEGAASVAISNLLPTRLSEALGSWCNYYFCGQGGTGYVANPGGGREVFGGTNRLASLVSINPDYIVILGSVNDDASFSSVQSAATTLYNAIALQIPNAKIIVVCPQSTSGSPSSNRNSNNTAVKNAAAACSNVIGVIDSIADGWITGTGRVGETTGSGNADIMIASDAVHPSTAGHLYWANRLYADIVNILYNYAQN